jgi:hypothetical protein
VDPDLFINFAQGVVVGNDDTTVDEQAGKVSSKFSFLETRLCVVGFKFEHPIHPSNLDRSRNATLSVVSVTPS